MTFDVGSPELMVAMRTADRKYLGIRAAGTGSEVYPIDPEEDLRVQFDAAMKAALGAHPDCVDFEIVTSHEILLGLPTSAFQCVQMAEPRSMLRFRMLSPDFPPAGTGVF